MGPRLGALITLAFVLPVAGADHEPLPTMGVRYLDLTDLASGATLQPATRATESNGHPIHHDDPVDEACHYAWIIDNARGAWCHRALTQDEPTGHACVLRADRTYEARVRGLAPHQYYSVTAVHMARPTYGLGTPVGPLPGSVVERFVAISLESMPEDGLGTIRFQVDPEVLEPVPLEHGGPIVSLFYLRIQGPPTQGMGDDERTSFGFPWLPAGAPTQAAPPDAPCLS